MTDTERLNALFEEWLLPDEKYYYEINKKNDNVPKYNPKAFVKDGIINEESYKRQDKKILFVLKEAYLSEINNEDHDMRKWLKLDDDKNVNNILNKSHATWRRIIEWTYGIRHSDENTAAEFPDELFTGRKDDIKRSAAEIFGTIAVMNIKKSYGRRRSNSTELKKNAYKFRTQLKKEIEIISPDIIVCCGTKAMLDEVYSGDMLNALNGRIIVIDTCHPAKWAKKKDKYNAVVNAYRQALKGE